MDLKQTVLDIKFGNCLQTCFAKLLNKPLDHVPNFMLFEEHWSSALIIYLGLHGYSFEYVVEAPPKDGEQYITSLKFLIHSEGITHAVIMKDGIVVFDPWPNINYKYEDAMIYGYYKLIKSK